MNRKTRCGKKQWEKSKRREMPAIEIASRFLRKKQFFFSSIWKILDAETTNISQ